MNRTILVFQRNKSIINVFCSEHVHSETLTPNNKGSIELLLHHRKNRATPKAPIPFEHDQRGHVSAIGAGELRGIKTGIASDKLGKVG